MRPQDDKNKTEIGKKANTISGNRKVLLLLFCIAAAAIVFYSAMNSFSGKQKVPSSPEIQKPASMLDNARKTETAISITDQEYLRIQNFKQYMETISNTPSGRRMFDSILIARPGLLDSIIIIEEIYQSQTK